MSGNESRHNNPSEESCPYCPPETWDNCQDIEHWKEAADYWCRVAFNGFEEIDRLNKTRGDSLDQPKRDVAGRDRRRRDRG